MAIRDPDYDNRSAADGGNLRAPAEPPTDTEAATVWERLLSGARRPGHIWPRYIAVLHWASQPRGYVPGQPGVGATNSIHQKRARKLERFGLLVRRDGRYHTTDLGRRVAAHGARSAGRP